MKQQFLTLYDEYYPKLYAYILVRVHRREVAEDIVQQTFVKALDNIDSFKPRRNATFGSWLFRIAKNELVDTHRSNKKLEFQSTEVMEEVHGEKTVIDELIETDVADSEQKNWRAVMNAIVQLSDAERELITLKYLSGMSYKDISVLMNKKPNTLAVMLRRALEKIRKEIGYEKNERNN